MAYLGEMRFQLRYTGSACYYEVTLLCIEILF